ncbi:MAG: MFS transporter [Calditrichia bacterium]
MEEIQAKSLFKDRRLYVIFGITLIAVMGVASITPAFPKIAAELHLSKARIGLLISAFTFPGILLAPLTGILADLWGRKKVLVPSLFIFAAAGFAIFFIRSFWIIILLRFLQGIGAASLGSLNVTLIGDFYKGKSRPAAMGYNASVLSLSTAFYPLIGGALAGFAWHFPFLLPLLAIPVGLVVIFCLEEPHFEQSGNFRKYLRNTYHSLMRKDVLAVFLLSILTFIILYGALLTYLPFLLNQKFSLSAPQIGFFFWLSSITTALLATQIGRLTGKLGSVRLLKTAFFIYTAVMLLLPRIGNLYLLVLPVLLFGCAQGLNIPSLQTVLANLAPDNQRGVFMSTNGMVLRLGQTLGPLIIGVGYTLGDIAGAYNLATIMAILGLFILFTLISDARIRSAN